MVPVVVDPFVEEIFDPQVSDRRMSAAAAKIGRAKPTDQGNALPAQTGELLGDSRRRTVAVAAGAGDRALIPGLEQRLVAGEDDANASREPAPLGLDEVPKDLLRAPFSRRRMPREGLRRQRGEFGEDRRRRALQQSGDFPGHEGAHLAPQATVRRASLTNLVTGRDGFL
jgi:hypothetical protein